MKYIYRHSDCIVVYGSHVRNYLVGLGVSNDKIFCAPHTVDNEFFRKYVSDQEKQDLREQLGLSIEKIILFVGRFEECKGLSYLIEAVSMMKDINYCLVFIGTGSMRTFFEEQCKRSAVRYLFLSHIPNQELYRYYAIADIFTLPSITTAEFKEPWGVVVNEAMNQGCPVIATDAVGAAAGGLVEDGKNGFIVPERDSLALKKAMETLLRDDDLRRRMGREARDKIERWGGPEQTVLGFVEAIEFVRGKKVHQDT
jgi:glycosyltransferase involved in cell wall biosynthesis